MGETALGSKRTILIVEDDPVSGLVLFDYLMANGYRPLLARSGPQGVEAFAEQKPDLVVLDVRLPKMNGFEVCFAIRRVDTRHTPVLFMSAVYTDVAHAESYAREGLAAQGYLVKPFELGELLTRIRALLH